MASLFADENFATPIIIRLQALGHDIITLGELEQANQGISDAEVLQLASRHNRILLTFNRKDFIKLHQENPHHAGIIICTIDTDFNALAERIHRLLEDNPNLAGQLSRINRPNP